MTTASLGICGNTRLGHVYEDSLRDILCGGSRTLVNRKRGREKWLVYTDYLSLTAKPNPREQDSIVDKISKIGTIAIFFAREERILRIMDG